MSVDGYAPSEGTKEYNKRTCANQKIGCEDFFLYLHI